MNTFHLTMMVYWYMSFEYRFLFDTNVFLENEKFENCLRTLAEINIDGLLLSLAIQFPELLQMVL